MKSLQNTLTKNLPSNIASRVVQTGTKLPTRFNIKDQVDAKHLSNFIYHHKCANKKCKDSYIGKTARTRTLRTEEHRGRDKNCWIFKHSLSTKPPRAKDSHFEFLTSNDDNKRKGRLPEPMYVRDMKPTLDPICIRGGGINPTDF